jgi:4-diphosphocytidyl-2-C-methyl-D-erythritol kinase
MNDMNGHELKKKRISVYLAARAVKSFDPVSPPRSVTIFSPAKINLFLAVTGRRSDGYHDLVSIVAPLDFGDSLRAESGDRIPESGNRSVESGEFGAVAGGQFSMACDHPDVPLDHSNLILKAAAAFVAATGWKAPVAFQLTKRIPVGAGMGGGSSNATAALLALNQLSGANLGRAELAVLAAAIGSDCPLFLEGGPVIMRGRGERIESLPDAAAGRVRGRKVLVFKPSIGVSTAWAYERMAAGAPQSYLPAAEAERLIAAWIDGNADAAELLFNNLEPVVFRKFIALPTLLDRLGRQFGLKPGMSGSGSACFALLAAGAPVPEMLATIRDAWGPACFAQAVAFA